VSFVSRYHTMVQLIALPPVAITKKVTAMPRIHKLEI